MKPAPCTITPAVGAVPCLGPSPGMMCDLEPASMPKHLVWPGVYVVGSLRFMPVVMLRPGNKAARFSACPLVPACPLIRPPGRPIPPAQRQSARLFACQSTYAPAPYLSVCA